MLGFFRSSAENEGKGGGGQGGIRTHEGLAPLLVFKTSAFNRSATCPQEQARANDKSFACHHATCPPPFDPCFD